MEIQSIITKEEATRGKKEKKNINKEMSVKSYHKERIHAIHND